MHENLKHIIIKHLTKKIKKYPHFQTVTINNSKHFRFHIQQYWRFQEVTSKSYYTLFQSSYQTILTLSGSYYQTTLYFGTSNNTNIFRELLANNTTNFYRFHIIIKQYWIIQRVVSKLNYSKIFFQSSYHTILTLSDSYYQTILNYSELILNIIHTFTELLSNNSIHFFESLNGQGKFSNGKFPSKKEKS